MKPAEFISLLKTHHAKHNQDYIESLARDHESNNIFVRFVANVRLKRFFQSATFFRPEQKVREALNKISERLTPLIIEDWHKLANEEQWNQFRFLHLLPEYNTNYHYEDGFLPIKFDEHIFKRVYGQWSWDDESMNALREFWRIDKEPGLLDMENWGVNECQQIIDLCKADLEEFESKPKPIKQPESIEKTQLDPEAPKVRKWKYEKQYFGYAAAMLIDENREIEMKPLAKELAKFFTDENNRPLKDNTIRLNMLRWRNRKEEIESFQMIETMRIFEKEKQYIQAVIDYFVKTR